MRTFGRIVPNVLYPDVTQWVEVTTDDQGYNDAVYLTALVQVLKLNLGESPFWGDWGIPAKPAIVQQVFPDYYSTLTAQRFAPRFASLILTKVSPTPLDNKGRPVPTYSIAVVTQYGSKIGLQVAV
jgi:hypothetical protein